MASIAEVMRALKIASAPLLGSLMVSLVCNTASAKPVTPSASQAVTTCDVTPPTNLQRTTRYGIFGDDQFDTLVCGYLVPRQEEVFGEKVTVAYFRINKFYDEGFKAAIKKGIDSGNNVNSVRNGVYEFNLGCLSKKKIVGDNGEEGKTYIAASDQATIIQSSVKQPIPIILSFNQHEGSDCTCCNLAEQVRVLK
jgi:hypothetical protein